MENFSAWHDVAFGTKENGFAGFDTEYTFNSPLHVKHIQQLADWQKDKIFVYGGRTNKGNPKFIQGECAMYTESSAGYGSFKAGAKFEFGAANLPYWPEAKGAPQNTIIGGASLWVMGRHSAGRLQGRGQVRHLPVPAHGPGLLARQHRLRADHHGRLRLDEKGEVLQGLPRSRHSHLQMSAKPPTANSKGLRFGNFLQVRDVMYEELENIFAGKKTAKQGLDDAVNAAM